MCVCHGRELGFGVCGACPDGWARGAHPPCRTCALVLIFSVFGVALFAGAFFSVLFNLQKFTLFEQRDPVVVKQELNEGGIT